MVVVGAWRDTGILSGWLMVSLFGEAGLQRGWIDRVGLFCEILLLKEERMKIGRRKEAAQKHQQQPFLPAGQPLVVCYRVSPGHVFSRIVDGTSANDLS